VDDEQLKRGAWAGMVEFQRIVGTHAPAARLAETAGYVASAVPDVPSSLINAAVPRDAAPLAPHLDDIEAFYAHSRKWGAWLDPAAVDDAEALRDRGLVLDSSPVLMATVLGDIAGLRDSRPAHQATMQEVGAANGLGSGLQRVDMQQVVAVNDLAYANPHPVIADTLHPFPADELHVYGIGANDEIASVALVIDAGDDAFVTMVATLPHHRGKHLASNLLARALTDARQRGQTTTSLQASKLGQGIYARLGYRSLGEVHLYEKRPA
jgi:ribosomal protein S18 acetylase RimI-like enzyme